MDGGDLIAFIFSYLPMLAVWLIVTVLLGIGLVFARRKNNQPPRSKRVAPVLLASIVAWIIYFAATAQRSWAIAMLGSERDQTAEYAYQNNFRVSLRDALSIAQNDSYSGNVRFYAAFRAADLLATADDRLVSEALNRVESAPAFQTGFFGWNGLTRGYFQPGYQEGPYEVGDLIRRRLQNLRDQTNALKKL